MKKQLKKSFVAMAGLTLFVSACTAPTMPLTPETLAGCYEGDALFGAVTAKVDVKATDDPRSFIVDGEASGAGQTLPINNQRVTLTDQNELEVEGSANLPFQMKVDGSEIRVTSESFPVSLTLRRCS